MLPCLSLLRESHSFFFELPYFRAWFVIVCGVLHGMVDCCHTTMRSFISTLAVPKKRLQTYSVAKLFQVLLHIFLFKALLVFGYMHWVIPGSKTHYIQLDSSPDRWVPYFSKFRLYRLPITCYRVLLYSLSADSKAGKSRSSAETVRIKT